MSLRGTSALALLATAILSGCGGGSGVAGGPTPAATPVALNSGNPVAQDVTAPSATTPPVATTPAVPIPTTGTATLAWTPPSQTTDDTPLYDLAGYFVYYGPDADHLSQRVNLGNPGLSAYVIDALPQGNYAFALSAYNTAGIESALSNVITKTVL